MRVGHQEVLVGVLNYVPPDPPDRPANSLQRWIIASIVVVPVIVFILLGVIIFLLVRRYRNRRKVSVDAVSMPLNEHTTGKIVLAFSGDDQ